jgi:hypothetical protein
MHHRNNKWEVWGLESPAWDRVVEWLKNGLLFCMALASGYALVTMVFCM